MELGAASALITAEQVARVFVHKDRLNMCVPRRRLEGEGADPRALSVGWGRWDKRLAALQGWHRELLAAERAAAPLTDRSRRMG